MLACSRFAGTDEPAPDASAEGAPADGGAVAPMDAAEAAAALCEGGVHYLETFDGISDVSLFHGFSADDSNSAAGELAIADTDAIEAGLTPPYLLATARFVDGGTARQAITKVTPFRPSRVTVAFDVGLGVSDTYVEYGCGVCLWSSGDASDSTLIDFQTNQGSRTLVLGASTMGTSEGAVDLVAVPPNTSRHVVLDIVIGSDARLEASGTVSGKDGMDMQRLPSFQAPSAIEATQLSCGILFSSTKGAGTVEAAIDNVDVTICP